ncbi:MAG: SUMF1/EgtB/PvdO family nonheme iron enzyme [Flavobacteriaceae bacterium]|nr:SUMF1/EgtB/PvdO family nonheme iron enzyme [Flavobacteriaceae bacterium]
MIKLEKITSLFNKKLHLLFFFFLTFCTNVEEKILKPVSVWEFREFVNESNYQTDAERYGWSIVQTDVYNYEIINGANWRTPDGINPSIDSLPVTQVSYNDAIEYSKWAGVSLPTYDQYWDIVASDKRLIVSDNMYPISPVADVNVIGNVWDITESKNTDQVRLAGGSLFCSFDTCHGTQEERELYVDKETGNIHIGFSILTE